MDPQDFPDLRRALDKQWELSLAPDEAEAYAALRQRVAEKIEEWMRHDMERLVQVMYRLDVDEAKFHAAMAQGPPPEAAMRLAEVVIARELQKVVTRKRYSQKRPDPEGPAEGA